MTLAITADVHPHSKTVSKSRIIAACTIGNALEFFDFVIFSFFARTIGQLFFRRRIRPRSSCWPSPPTASAS